MTQAIRDRRPARLPIVRPLMLTVFLALSACSFLTGKDTPGTRASGATPGNLAPEQSEDTMLKVADETRAGGDLGNAVGLYRRAHEMAPRDPVPMARAGETLAQMQSYTEAADAYQAALTLAPDDPELHRGFANVLLALGKPQLALAHLEIAVAKNSGDARTYNALGVAHDLAGRHDMAQQDYRRGLALAPDQPSLRNNLGLSQALSGDFKGAIATLSDLASRPGATPRNRQNLALVYGLAGDNTHAALVARSDLDEAAVRNNLAYFTLLRSLDDVGRTAAILGADVRAARAAAQPAATVTDPGVAAAPVPAPARAHTTRTPLPPPAPTLAALPVPIKTAKHAVLQPEQEPTPGTSLEPAEPTPSANLGPSTPAPSQSAKAATDDDEAAANQVASATPMAMTPAAPKAAKPKVESAQVETAKVEPASTEPQSEAALPPPAPAASAPVAVVHKTPAVAGKRLVVQLGSFQDESNAHKLTSHLKAKGIADLVVIHDRDRQGRDWYVVRTEDFATQEAAEAVAQSIRNAGQGDARVIRIASSD
ncbi:MAG TPA: tetratricopeptide repeat protein [Stellaceae bacterium]|nr:tetratricopeptide repeat protein [Stellaceae bacterium]